MARASMLVAYYSLGVLPSESGYSITRFVTILATCSRTVQLKKTRLSASINCWESLLFIPLGKQKV